MPSEFARRARAPESGFVWDNRPLRSSRAAAAIGVRARRNNPGCRRPAGSGSPCRSRAWRSKLSKSARDSDHPGALVRELARAIRPAVVPDPVDPALEQRRHRPPVDRKDHHGRLVALDRAASRAARPRNRPCRDRPSPARPPRAEPDRTARAPGRPTRTHGHWPARLRENASATWPVRDDRRGVGDDKQGLQDVGSRLIEQASA